MDLSKYRQLYLSETQENLEKLGRRIVELEARPAQREAVDTVFRLFHSIKGMSGTMGYTPMFDLAHQLEELMDRVRQDAVRAPEVIDALLAGVDRMGRWLGDIEADRLPLVVDAQTEALHARIHALVDAEADSTPAAPAAPAALDGVEPGDIVITLRPGDDCPEPAMRGLVMLRRLAALGQVRASAPTAELLRTGAFDGTLRIALATPHDAATIERFVRLAPEWGPPHIEVAAAVELAAGDDDDDLDFVGDLDLGGLDDSVDDAPEPAPEPEPTPAPAAIVRPPPRRTIRVRTDWLDAMLDRAAELRVVAGHLQALEHEAPDPRRSHLLGELSRLLGELHHDALSARMSALSMLTDRLPRVVRDLARQSGKQATLTVEGDELRVDRAIIEGLDAPLTHVLRNAIEHGVEPPSSRTALGKPPAGRLRIVGRRVRDEIVIEISDDGQGIDRIHLAERAVRLGLIDGPRAELLAERDLCRLVCLPGLSIRDRADALAGRGVGMDAVADAIGALGGRLEVDSARGEGTTVRLRLPRTLGVTRLLLVEAGGRCYAVPQHQVGKTVELGEGDPETVAFEGEALPVRALSTLLGLDAPATGPGLVLAADRVVVRVDRVVGLHDAVQKPLGPLLERVAGLGGVIVDPDGAPVFVLDLPRMIEEAAPTTEEPT